MVEDGRKEKKLGVRDGWKESEEDEVGNLYEMMREVLLWLLE